MLRLKEISKSNTKLINFNHISQITEETQESNTHINPNNESINKNNKISKRKSRKKSENNNVLISKNSLYMEKVLFFVDNMQKTNNSSPKFEDEFLVLKSDKNGEQKFEKKYIVPPNYINLKSNEIIAKNKSYKKLEKANGKVKLFEIFSNETLDNYNKDRLMVNDLDLKEKFIANAQMNAKNRLNGFDNKNNSFNISNKHNYLNTSLNNNNNNRKNLNNFSNKHNNNNNISSFDMNYSEKNYLESKKFIFLLNKHIMHIIFITLTILYIQINIKFLVIFTFKNLRFQLST